MNESIIAPANCANKPTLRQRFDEKFRYTPGCWLWTASIDRYGYGKIGRSGTTMKAHRVAFELYRHPVPNGSYVLHRCDNPRCVNPEHLFLGTAADNAADRKRKGRGVCGFATAYKAGRLKGESHGRARLTTSQVVAIRSDGRRHREIASEYGISQIHVSRIKRHVIWKSV